MMAVVLLQSDARALPLQDGSVHCCVTSPPYWGLRDYQTGAWQGGEAACPHRPSATPQRRGLASSTLGGGKTTTGHQQEGYGSTCGRCGAVRVDDQLGLEARHDCGGAFTGQPCGGCYVCGMRTVFAEVWRVLRNDGTLWLVMGDAYTSGNRTGHGTRVGYKQQTNRGMNGTQDPPRAPQPSGLRAKNLCGLPWRVALALQADGWILRSEIIWHKRNPMPESVRDRPTKGHEQVFLLAKRGRYYYDAAAISERQVKGAAGSRFHTGKTGINGLGRVSTRVRQEHGMQRNARSVWSLPSEGFKGTHLATFPQALVRRCILAGCPPDGRVLDPFVGAGTVPLVAWELGRSAVGCDLSSAYLHEEAAPRFWAPLGAPDLFTWQQPRVSYADV